MSAGMSIIDIQVSSISFGFTLGFGFLTAWEGVKQTRAARAPLRSAYIWMIWGEIIANAAIAIQGYLLLSGAVGVTLAYLIMILVLWVFELQLLMQIIINRLSIVMVDKRKAFKLKWGVALCVTLINISVFLIWIPARLQINPTIVRVNEIWDRIEKVLILIIDAALNWYFIKVVKDRLVSQGLTKYDALVRFNVRIILVSLAMDILIIGAMSLKNGATYIQLHPLAYIVKLKIEMSMAKLITKITREKTNIELTSTNATRDRLGNNKTFDAELERGEGKLTIHAQQEIAVESRSIEDPDGSMCSDGVVGRIHGRDDDDRPLNKGNQGVWDGRTGHSTSVETTDPRQRF